MSQPDNTTPPASAQPDGHLGELATAVAIGLLLRHAAQALRLEHGTAHRATVPVRAAAVALSRWTAAQWVKTAGGLDKPLDAIDWARLQPELVQRLRATKPDPAPTLPLDMEKAYRLGERQAHTALGLPAPRDTSLPRTLPLPDLAATVGKRWDTAERLLSTQPIQTFDQVTVALAPAHGAAGDVDRDVRTAVNTAVNLAAHDVAAQAGADLLWVAEPNACVVCLALSGTVVGADEDFDPDATFGDKPTAWWHDDDGPLRPPRHPRCRCRCEPFLGHAGPPGSLTLPDALKREAQRSILRGFSLPSESEGVRVRAADRLLKRGTNLPKSVRAYARRAVEKGRFPTRTLPTGKGGV